MDPTTLKGFISLGVVLVVAAAVGGGIEALGQKIPVLTGWKRQTIVAVLGTVLAAFSWWKLEVTQDSSAFQTAYQNVANGAAGSPPPPWTPQRLSSGLENLVVQAGRDHDRNCLIAGIIDDYHVAPMPFVIRENLQASQSNSAPWLQCYRDILAKASQTITATAAGPSATHLLAKNAPSADILKAATLPDTQGWMYLGKLQADGSLGNDRTILQTRVAQGDTVIPKTDVYLRREMPAGQRRKGAVVGIVPVGTKVTVRQLAPSSEKPYVWAQVSVAANSS